MVRKKTKLLRRHLRDRDFNVLAKLIVQLATRKNPDAVALGRKGGMKGGKARAAALSPKQRSKIARNAAIARWSQQRKIKH